MELLLLIALATINLSKGSRVQFCLVDSLATVAKERVQTFKSIVSDRDENI